MLAGASEDGPKRHESMDQGFKEKNMFSVKMWSKTTLHALAVVLVLFVGARAAYSQATLTGAIQFATDSTGVFTTDVWNALGGDTNWDLWLALNPDATSPVNGPNDGWVVC